MLKKNPKPSAFSLVFRAWREWTFFRRGVKTLVVAEILALAGSYALWRPMNNSRDFRLHMHQNWPLILEVYYQVGENLSGHKQIRESDLSAWKEAGKIVS